MLFLLHIAPMSSVTESPDMTHESCEFILQCIFKCTGAAVLREIGRQFAQPKPEFMAGCDTPVKTTGV